MQDLFGRDFPLREGSKDVYTFVSCMTEERAQDSATGLCLRGSISGRDCVFPLQVGLHRVGRAPTNDVLLPVPQVSRRHAQVTVHPTGTLKIVDKDSLHGTFVNGKNVTKAVAGSGDRLRFGPVSLQVESFEAQVGSTEKKPAADDKTLALVFETMQWPSNGDREPSTQDDPSDVFDSRLSSQLQLPPHCLRSRSPSMIWLYEEILRLAPGRLPLLIQGETGVGKELIAQAVHLNSERSDQTFEALNCAALSEDLLEAELFGIGSSVATGVRPRAGVFRSAHRGTLVLDEIGELPLVAQVKLLRVLQEGKVRPVGERPVRVDVRILAMTNRNLREEIRAGRFRKDLYYRIAGTVLTVPPLRDRHVDIPLLVEHFLRRAAGEAKRSPGGLTARAMQVLQHYAWPGNVRELEHEMERLVLLAQPGEVVRIDQLSSRLLRSGSEDTDGVVSLRLEPHVQSAERRAIERALAEAGGSQRQAARLLEISRNTLARKIKRLGLAVDAP